MKYIVFFTRLFNYLQHCVCVCFKLCACLNIWAFFNFIFSTRGNYSRNNKSSLIYFPY